MRNFEDLQIAVAGTGYVGLSIATLLSQHHKVTAVDVIPEKVEKINNRISPIQDEYIEKYFAEKELNLTATLDGASAYKDADFVVIAAPTNYDPAKNFFDTHHIEDVIDLVLSVNPEATMVIKSTIPVGYCRSLYVKYALYETYIDIANWGRILHQNVNKELSHMFVERLQLPPKERYEQFNRRYPRLINRVKLKYVDDVDFAVRKSFNAFY